MKSKKLVLIGILILFVVPIILAEDFKEEIPLDEAMKLFCGTWYLEPGRYRCSEERLVFNLDGKYEFYYPKIIAPTYSGTFKIDKAWKDSGGNNWFIVSKSKYSGTWSLIKISENGTDRESIMLLNLDNIPTEIGPDDYRYCIANKKPYE